MNKHMKYKKKITKNTHNDKPHNNRQTDYQQEMSACYSYEKYILINLFILH